ncbi:MAG TPA: hypothetical protein VKA45_09600 [Gaiellaceae bacterium]|nr:hypothetical protein [Gaiellaceae bacterium]
MQRTINPIRRFAPTVVLALIILAAFGAGAAGAAGVGEGKAAPQADAFVPGVTDFPSRLGEVGERAAEARLAHLSQQGLGANGFVPVVTDFPSRLGEIGERAAEARLAQVSQPAPGVTATESAFDWTSGATGAVAATLLLLGAALAVRTARSSRVALG